MLMEPSATPIADDDLYALALAEVSNNDQQKGLWARALVDADGNRDVAIARYIKSRAGQLTLTKAESQKPQEPAAVVEIKPNMRSNDQSRKVLIIYLLAFLVIIVIIIANELEPYYTSSSSLSSVQENNVVAVPEAPQNGGKVANEIASANPQNELHDYLRNQQKSPVVQPDWSRIQKSTVENVYFDRNSISYQNGNVFVWLLIEYSQPRQIENQSIDRAYEYVSYPCNKTAISLTTLKAYTYSGNDVIQSDLEVSYQQYSPESHGYIQYSEDRDYLCAIVQH